MTSWSWTWIAKQMKVQWSWGQWTLGRTSWAILPLRQGFFKISQQWRGSSSEERRMSSDELNTWTVMWEQISRSHAQTSSLRSKNEMSWAWGQWNLALTCWGFTRVLGGLGGFSSRGLLFQVHTFLSCPLTDLNHRSNPLWEQFIARMWVWGVSSNPGFYAYFSRFKWIWEFFQNVCARPIIVLLGFLRGIFHFLCFSKCFKICFQPTYYPCKVWQSECVFWIWPLGFQFVSNRCAFLRGPLGFSFVS